MHTSSRLERIRPLSLFLALVISLILLDSTKVAAHAASTLLKPSLQSRKVSATLRSSCGTWRVVPSPTFAGTGSNYLSGVAAVSATNVWAVGSYNNFSQTLIEHWNGQKWSVVPSPSPGLSYNDLRGVTALSAHNIWAVGAYRSSSGITQTLIEHWNGSKWSIVPSPNPGQGGNYLYGVAALSATNVRAVGNYINASTNNFQTLIEHWNGRKWRVVSSPNIASQDNYLYGVTALSPSNVWAVGASAINNTHQTLIEHWDGTSWSIISSPNLSEYNDLYGVTALSSDDIWAVGGAVFNTLVEHWDGSSWSVIPSPSPGSGAKSLNGLTALSATSVWAVGSAQTGSNGMPQTLIEHWDGTNWGVVSSPNVGSYNNTLYGVAWVPGSSQVWAVGSYNDSNDVGQTLTELYC